MTAIRTILVPLDGTSPSLAALEYAVEMARDYVADLEVLVVVPDESHLTGQLPVQTAVIEAALEWARDRIETYVLTRLCTGDPLRRIVEASVGVDLVVMGTHARVGRLQALRGSIADSVIHNAACPVLVIRDDREAQQSFADRRHHRPTLGEQVAHR